MYKEWWLEEKQNVPVVQCQGYMVDVTSLPNQALINFGEWVKMCVV